MPAEHPDEEWIGAVIADLQTWIRERRASTPTSQITGGGAVGHVEERLTTDLDGRPALLQPSATWALWVALRILGVRAGDEVLVPRYDWSASSAVVLALGATPVVVACEPTTLTIDPTAVRSLATARTRAIIATHLLGIPADVPALRRALPGVPVVEDCAQAAGSTLDGRRVGTLSDAAVFSYGPGKRVDVGELGALAVRDDELRDAALRESAHTIRQRLGRVRTPEPRSMSVRPHPLAAVLLEIALDRHDPDALIAGRARFAARLADAGLPLLGVDARRGVATRTIPLVADHRRPAGVPDGVLVGRGEVVDVAALLSDRPASMPVLLLDEGGES